MSEDFLERIVDREISELKHSERHYLNKEIFVGEIVAFGGALAVGFGCSYFFNSKELLSFLGTIGSCIGYNVGFIGCAYVDRRRDFKRLKNFCWHLVKISAKYGLPASVAYHSAHITGTYGLQHIDISAGWSAALAHIPSIPVGIGVANLSWLVENKFKAHFKKSVEYHTSDKYLKYKKC